MKYRTPDILLRCRQFPSRWLTWFFVVFYLVGLMLFSYSATRPLFFLITPFSLLLVTGLVLCRHQEWTARFTGLLSTVFILSFSAEWVGVKTGLLFGEYHYLSSLGPKLSGVPLMIGINWILLVYCSAAIFTNLRLKGYLKVTGASLLMVLYDLILEMAAPVMKMWDFYGEFPPLRNFLAWFALALCFHSLFYLSGIKPEAKPARGLFFIQAAFFILVVMTDNLFR